MIDTDLDAPAVEPVLVDRSNTLANLTASEFLRLLRRDEVTVLDYAIACADVIECLDPDVGAWAFYERDRFLASARQADTQVADHRRANNGSLPGLVTGVPFGVKDIFNTADMPTSHGSRIFAEYTPGNDARVVTNMRREGSLIAGKTATAEFAVHAPARTRNPHDLARSCGTSSSGSAAAVACGMVPAALASQTAGSTIRPASYCGIYGFKPSYGLLPRTAMLKTTDTLDSVGCMARSVEDLSLLLEVMRVRGPNYPIVDAAMNDPARRSIGDRPWRVGLLFGPKSGTESAAARTGIRRLADRLATTGCVVEEFFLPAEFDRAHDVHEAIYRKALAYYFRMEWAASREQFSGPLAAMIDRGNAITPEEYRAALSQQVALVELYDRALESYDVVFCPATADEAPVGLDTPDPPDHCLIFTMCYAPVVSIPALKGSNGLPIGVQVASRRFNDYLVLQFAALVAVLVA